VTDEPNTFSWANAQRRLRERLKAREDSLRPVVTRRAPSARVRRNRVRIGLLEVE